MLTFIHAVTIAVDRGLNSLDYVPSPLTLFKFVSDFNVVSSRCERVTE